MKGLEEQSRIDELKRLRKSLMRYRNYQHGPTYIGVWNVEKVIKNRIKKLSK